MSVSGGGVIEPNTSTCAQDEGPSVESEKVGSVPSKIIIKESSSKSVVVVQSDKLVPEKAPDQFLHVDSTSTRHASGEASDNFVKKENADPSDTLSETLKAEAIHDDLKNINLNTSDCQIPDHANTHSVRDKIKTEHHEQKVILIRNSGDLDVSGMSPHLLGQVKSVLESSEPHSIMIVSEEDRDQKGNDNNLMYMVDLKTVISSTAADQSSSCDIFSNASSVSELLPKSTSVTTPVNDTESQFIDDIKYIPISSDLDLSIPTCEGEISIETTHPISKPSTPFIPKSIMSNTIEASVEKQKNLDKAAHNLPATSTSSSSCQDDVHVTSTPKLHSQAAEHLLHIAKKMIEDTKQGSQNVTVDETSGRIIISSPEAQPSGEKGSSESVITMYLSSPNELRSKLEKLKTNSPVIVMQAGECPILKEEDDKEGGKSVDKENAFHVKDENSLGSEVMDEKTLPNKSDLSVSENATDDDGLEKQAYEGVLYRCVECGYSSHNKHYYKQHVDLVHNKDRPYKCPHCDYAGKRRHALLEHMVVHSNQRPFTCDHCNASFRKKGHLTNHVKLHTSQRLVHCGVCNIQLPDTEAFEAHLRKIHKTDKLYKCQQCEHTAVDRITMIRHLHTHKASSEPFSCPKCPSSSFKDKESLLSHMNSTHNNIALVSVGKGQSPNEDEAKSNTVVKVKTEEGAAFTEFGTANIMCSECRFVCTDRDVMKDHMWMHIKVEEKPLPSEDSQNKKESTTDSLGVLKMNVASGLKTLPRNIAYQCTTCKFTSSDNSAFIKHMLLHKTQRKQQYGDTSKQMPTWYRKKEETDFESSRPVSSNKFSSNVDAPFPAESSQEGSKVDTNVPFIYDKTSARFRCVICGYHCEFQRTIKAHIWKHSGHKNIEYPVFEHGGKDKTDDVITPTSGSQTQTSQEAAKPAVKEIGSHPNLTSVPPQLPAIKTKSGVVQLIPVTSLSSQVTTSDSSSLKDKPLVVPSDSKNSSVGGRILETVSDTSNSMVGIGATVTLENTASSVHSIDQGVEDEKEKVKSENETSVISNDAASKEQHLGDTECGDVSGDEGCTEPSVVVEIVDTVPTESGLTGMKSQQGSPRVLDLDGSGSEKNLSQPFHIIKTKELPNFEISSKGRYNLRKGGVDKTSQKNKKSDESSSVRLRCPKCDCLLTTKEELRSHLMDCKVNAVHDHSAYSKGNAKNSKSSSAKKKKRGNDQNKDDNDDTDATESSDELGSAGESAGTTNQQKSGICSSLLAVIEQLRERSRSESEGDEKRGNQMSKKAGKKRKLGAGSDSSSLIEFQNIETIKEEAGDKYRCSLCHYTSQRVCNIQLHMKTHRQKKSTECSLCEFSSSSPEALQSHMLLHCKVRTYSCKFCPQSFNHKSTLRAHLRAHKGQDPFLCAYCVFETTNVSDYKEHMQVHSGCSSRLRCPGCDIILNSKEELTSHLHDCESKPVENTNTETIVVKMSEFESYMEAEGSQQSLSPTNQEHACVVKGCSFCSPNIKDLQDHLSVHCNPNLLVCDLCDFKALHSRSLKSHMKRHANDQRYVQQPLEQYKCNICGYVCHHLPSLKSHMWRHASDEIYSYEYTNDIINAAIDHDTKVDTSGEEDGQDLLNVINSERRIMEGELTKSAKCWVTFRCCSCGFETINKAKLNYHMRSHSDIIKKTLEVVQVKHSGSDTSTHQSKPPSKTYPWSKPVKNKGFANHDDGVTPAKRTKSEDVTE